MRACCACVLYGLRFCFKVCHDPSIGVICCSAPVVGRFDSVNLPRLAGGVFRVFVCVCVRSFVGGWFVINVSRVSPAIIFPRFIAVRVT